jgi:hypothetical protein
MTQKVEKKKERIRKRKEKGIFLSPLSAGPTSSPTRARPPPSPLFPAQAAQTARHSRPLTARPRPSAPRSSLSRAALSHWQPDPTCQLFLPRPSLPGAIAAEHPSPHRLAINARQPLRDNPASVPEPSPRPQPARAVSSPFAPCPPSWKLVGARRPLHPSSPSRAPIKGTAEPEHSTPAPASSSTPPRAQLS